MSQPSGHQRVFSASDVAQFEYCPLAWWYEEVSEVAQADEDELERYLGELEARAGSAATTLPEYQVAARLLQRARLFEQGKTQHAEYAMHETEQGTWVEEEEEEGETAQEGDASESEAAPPPVPLIFRVVVFSLIVLMVVLFALGMWLWLR
jgi:CRISPR/Cas system-associated exonuclease Cas4 (RecB family)